MREEAGQCGNNNVSEVVGLAGVRMAKGRAFFHRVPVCEEPATCSHVVHRHNGSCDAGSRVLSCWTDRQ